MAWAIRTTILECRGLTRYISIRLTTASNATCETVLIVLDDIYTLNTKSGLHAVKFFFT